VVSERGVSEIVTYAINDHGFRERLETFCDEHGVALEYERSPGFLLSRDEFGAWLEENSLFMKSFYEWQRNRFDILMEDGSPVQGKYSFDQDNRESLPDDITVPDLPDVDHGDVVEDVQALVKEAFPNAPGDPDTFYWPVTRDAAVTWFEQFLEERFATFGPYQDAMAEGRPFLFHSLLSPLLNTGLLTPLEVVERAVEYYEEEDVHYPSVEGFIRQVLGWREFIKGAYDHVELRGNFFDHERGLTEAWWTGETGLPPLDDTIQRVRRYGYAHHIERLMIVSNAMLLCEIDPDEVYDWFMELFVDSAEWVMVPNVYGMGQFADGGSFATKPYISGSNYILKMSDYDSGAWCDVWDGLYWRFIDEHRAFFKENNRMRMMVGMFDRLSAEKKERILPAAEDFLDRMTKK
jgi:deoxyribodipyrimidine photolyase-related protein